ncbi:MAG: hypothetical protein CMH22_06255 [Methylophaga sp.]|nr:hypothetical protein [Methylophaga sp.]|tara:strand:+ start:536 stop:721 length:186 start_codon:yes stop_codon:yes gene_type:complete
MSRLTQALAFVNASAEHLQDYKQSGLFTHIEISAEDMLFRRWCNSKSKLSFTDYKKTLKKK